MQKRGAGAEMATDCYFSCVFKKGGSKSIRIFAKEFYVWLKKLLIKACLGIIIYQILVKSPQKFRLKKCGIKIIHEEARHFMCKIKCG